MLNMLLGNGLLQNFNLKGPLNGCVCVLLGNCPLVLLQLPCYKISTPMPNQETVWIERLRNDSFYLYGTK